MSLHQPKERLHLGTGKTLHFVSLFPGLPAFLLSLLLQAHSSSPSDCQFSPEALFPDTATLLLELSKSHAL